MNRLREAAQQALEAMEFWCPAMGHALNKRAEAVVALRAALAEPVLEPVQEHEDWCASVTQLLLCDPPRKAPCNCKKKVAEPMQPVAWLDKETNCAYTPEELDGEATKGMTPLYIL